jgi:hypothetical protein
MTPILVQTARRLNRRRLEDEIYIARRRSLQDIAFSPAWAASIEAVQELERQLLDAQEPRRG